MTPKDITRELLACVVMLASGVALFALLYVAV